MSNLATAQIIEAMINVADFLEAWPVEPARYFIFALVLIQMCELHWIMLPLN